MQLTAAPALFIGLGARVFLDFLTNSVDAASPKRSILLGVWQGIGLHYTFTTYTEILPFAIAIILAHSAIDFSFAGDYFKSICILLGIVAGALCTEVLSHFVDSKLSQTSKQSRDPSNRALKHLAEERQKLFQSTLDRETSQIARDEKFRQQLSDITSVGTDSELLRMNRSMTPLEREVARLRARASLADSERRRYKEERKWALEQGNAARASQMRWQVKKYTALMQSFNRQADEQLIEAANTRRGIRPTEAGVSQSRGGSTQETRSRRPSEPGVPQSRGGSSQETRLKRPSEPSIPQSRGGSSQETRSSRRQTTSTHSYPRVPPS